MIAFLTANAGTIAVLIVVLCVVGLIIRQLRKDKKCGRGFCGNNCAHCAASGNCEHHASPQKP